MMGVMLGQVCFLALFLLTGVIWINAHTLNQQSMLHSSTTSNHSDFSSNWTRWSPCNHHCKQTREKYCLNPPKCNGHIIREERRCPTKCRRQSSHLRSLPQRYSNEIINPQITTMRVPLHHHRRIRPHYETNKTSPIHHAPSHMFSQLLMAPVQGFDSNNFSSRNHTNQLNNDLFQPIVGGHNPIQDRIIKQSKHNIRTDTTNFAILRRSLYTKWSNWTKCTRSCTTQRFKHCRKKGTCKKNVLKETAYCYLEGSPCHRWIADHFGINYDDDSDEDDYDYNKLHEYDYKTDEVPKNLRSNCGVALIANSYSWPMLRIVGGHASAKDKWQWQIALLNKHKIPFCGGTLISPQWILTAAHCVRKHLYVRVNEHDLSYKDGTELEYRIYKSILHKDYNPDTVDNDIALLKLPVEISQTYACLPRHNQSLPYNTMCTITGWGKKNAKDEHGTKILHEAEVPIVSRAECRNSHKNLRITSNMFCAGFKHGGKDTCAGDSGGPLVCQSKPEDPITGAKPWVVHGITSFGEGCGRKGKFGVYIAVDNYVKWIHETIKNN